MIIHINNATKPQTPKYLHHIMHHASCDMMMMFFVFGLLVQKFI